MAGAEGRASALETALDEDGQHFDFIRFYKKVEVCDRSIRLEPLAGSKRGSGSAGGEEIPVSSIVVAKKSLVLQKMIFAGMKESKRGAPMTIRVTEEEKEAFKEMLHFFYAGSLSPWYHDSATDVRELVRLLVVGDKFEVPSLMGAVLKCLSNREMSITDSAVLVDQLPETLFQIERVKKVADEARAHIIEAFKDVSMTWKSDVLDLSPNPAVIEILLQSEELEADSEEEILEKTLDWIRESYESESERIDLFSKLSPHIRFLCLSGEYLEALLDAPEMRPKPTQALINDALRFQAYSDAKKANLKRPACERKGVRDVHLEIISDFVLDEEGTSVRSGGSAFWFGKKWHTMLQRKRNPARTVGVFLCCKSASEDLQQASSTVDDVEAKFFVKMWPEGIWKFCHRTSRKKFSVDQREGTVDDWGNANALDIPWEEARRSERFLGSTGAITIRVVARRFRDSESLQA